MKDFVNFEDTDPSHPIMVLYNRMFKNYIHGNSNMWDKWDCIESPTGRNEKDEVKSLLLIRDLLKEGYRVTTGYSATGVRGIRKYFILYKDWKGKRPGQQG